MDYREMIEVETLFSFSEDDLETMSVVDFVERINASVAKMPEELRAGAAIKMWCTGDYAHAYIELLRSETLDEKAEREAEVARREMRCRDEQHNRELMMYERLKAKYG